jgi:hypothetical protein
MRDGYETAAASAVSGGTGGKKGTHREIGALVLLCALFLLNTPLALGAEIAVGPILQFPEDGTMTIMWETNEESAGDVVYREWDGERSTISPVCSGTHHRVRLDRLTPGKKYEYHIRDGGRVIYTSYFNNLSARDSYRAVIISDAHVPKEGFSRLVPTIRDARPDFIIFLGDMVTDGGEMGQWVRFFQAGRTLFDHVPLFTVPGNHDLDGDDRGVLYGRFFCRPEDAADGLFNYTARLNGDRFIFLDVQRHTILSTVWFFATLLDSVVKRDHRRLFVFAHEGITSFKDNRAGSLELKSFHLMMVLCRVTALFSGHDHHYVRGKTFLGLPFFISSGGGGALYPVHERRILSRPAVWMEASYGGDHFLVLLVDGSRCVIRAVNERGETVDEVDVGPRR